VTRSVASLTSLVLAGLLLGTITTAPALASADSTAARYTTTHLTTGRPTTGRPTTSVTCPAPPAAPLHRIPGRSGRKVALTFDDGPSPTSTRQILAILARNHLAATFFVTGAEATAHPDLVRAIVAEGSLVGNHTYHHYQPGAGGAFDRLPRSVIRSEVDSTTRAIRAAGAPAPCFFRAPGGRDSGVTMRAVIRSEGMTMINWTYDPRDWAAPHKASPSYQRHIVAYATGTSSHAIVLDHDGPDRAYRGNTVAALQSIINYYRQHGYTFTDPVGRPLGSR